MDPIRRRARRLAPADRRQQLLACAVPVFAERGLGRAGHADVARAAAVSVPTVFSYFRTRQALVHSVLEAVASYYEEMADRFHRPDRPASAALLEHAVAFATSVQSDPSHARVLLEWSSAIREEVWPLFLRFQEGMVRRCEETITRGQAAGDIAADVDAGSSALMLVGATYMLMQMSFTHWPIERVQRYMLAQLRGAIGADALTRALG